MSFDPSIENIATLLAPLSMTWGFCGGWAIDLFLNRITRSHKDVDVAVWRTDQNLVFAFLRQRGWTLELAEDGQLIPLPEGEYISLPFHTVWCRNTNYSPDFLEILLNEAEEDKFLFRRDPSTHYPRNQTFMRAQSGLPILAPEIALLYKSKSASQPENRADFQAILPALSTSQRQWLAQALYKLSPKHEWLEDLTS